MRRIFCVYTITGKLIIYLNILVSAMSHGTSYKFSQPAELCVFKILKSSEHIKMQDSGSAFHMLLNNKSSTPIPSTHSCQVHEVRKLVVGDITAGARHSAPLCDVVHHLDFIFPCVDITPVFLLQNPGGRHQGIKVLSTVDLANTMSRIQNVQSYANPLIASNYIGIH